MELIMKSWENPMIYTYYICVNMHTDILKLQFAKRASFYMDKTKQH